MSGKKIISILLFVISFAMIGSGVYLMSSNKYMFETSLGKVLSYVNKVNETDNTFIEGLDSSDKYKITTNNDLVYMDNKLNLSGDLYFDSTNQYYVDLDAKVNGETDKTIGLVGLLEDKKVFFKIKDVMKEFYYTNIEENLPDADVIEEVNYEEIFKLSSKDIKVLTDHLKNSISKNISNNDITKVKTTLSLSGQNVSLDKLSLKLTDKMLTSIVKDYLKALSNDTKAIQVLQKVDKTITKNDIKTAMDSIVDSTSNDELLTLSFYCKGFGNVTRIELSTGSNEVDSIAMPSVLLAIDTYTNKNKYNTTAITLEAMGEGIKFEKAYTAKDKANLNIEVKTSEGNLVVTGTLLKNNSTIDLTLTPTFDGQSLGNVTFKITTVNKNKEYKLEIGASIEGLSEGSITLNSTNNIYLNEEIPDVDVSNAKNIDELSEEELNQLRELLQIPSSEKDSDYIEE